MRCWTILTVVTVWLGTTLAFPIEHPSGLYNIALERRSDEPPRPKLTGEQYTAKLQRSLREMQAAFAKDRGLEAKVLKTLGLKKFSGENLLIPELNNALKKAGYKGPFLPDTDELEETSVYRGEVSREYQDQEVFATPLIVRALRDPLLLFRVRIALGLDPEGPIPEEAFTDQQWNEALRKAGYTGVLFPETDPPRPRIVSSSGGGGSGGTSGSGGTGFGRGSPGGSGFGGRPNHGSGPNNKSSLNNNEETTPPWSRFLSGVGRSLRQKLEAPTSTTHHSTPGSQFQPAPPPFPAPGRPFGAFRPLK